MKYCHLDSPVGRLLLAGDEAGLRLISFPGGSKARQPKPDWSESPDHFTQACRQLSEYFAGTRRQFDLELAPHGTRFQLEVLRALQQIPYGKTASYADIAQKIGRPRAVRAVGAANGRNPLPIIIPCHRVIGANGQLTGFGGGLSVKAALLRLEGARLSA